MKKFSSRLKKTAPLILLGLILDHSPVHHTAQALVGGPFDSNNYDGVTADGTYSGTVSGHNLTGIVTFGVDSSAEGNGRFAIFHEGFVQYGAAAGIADVESRRLAGSFLGVAPLIGIGIAAIAAGPGSVNETVGGSAPTVNGAAQALTVRSALEGSFVARMKGYPNYIKFEGDGRLSTSANTAVVTTQTALANPAVTPGYTVFFGSNGSPQIQSDSPNPDSNNAATGGNISVNTNPQRAVLRSETPFKIRGSRTSRSVFRALNSYSAIPPIAPQAGAATPTPTPTPAPIIIIP